MDFIRTTAPIVILSYLIIKETGGHSGAEVTDAAMGRCAECAMLNK